MNRVILIGRLGADPEGKTLPTGTKVSNARLATDERWKNEQGEPVKRTEWHRLVCFGKIAETFEAYCKKGRRIAVEGRLQTREWLDQNKTKHWTTEIVVNSIEFLDSAQAQAPAETAPAPTEAQIPDDDVPF